MQKKIIRLYPFLILFLILAVGAFLRLYDIDRYMTFLGDEGRDVLIVKRMIVDGKWTLLGPTASVGGFFMGPIYYYFMLPFLWLFGLNPVGPAVMVALFGIATIYLVYLVGKNMVNTTTGLVSSSLYAVSPFITAYSRSSWNPNIVPFFALFLIYELWRVVARNKWKELFWIGIIMGIGLQLHYVFLFLFGVVGVWFLVFGRSFRYIKEYAKGCIGFIIGFSPFLAFEIRHGFSNVRAITSFIFEGKDTGFAVSTLVGNGRDIIFRLFSRLLLRIPEKGMLGNLPFWEKTAWIDVSWFLTGIVLAFFLVILFKKSFRQRCFPKLDAQKYKEMGIALSAWFIWLIVVLFFFGLYKKNIYDYYFGIIYPLPFLLVGLAVAALEKRTVWRLIAYAGLAGLLIFNLMGMPFRYQPNNQLGQVELIAKEVIDKTNGLPFNFALISGGNSDHAYRYFFEIWDRKPVTIENEQIDPQRKTTTDQLLIVCEDISCQPVGNSLWEVAGFGRAEIEGVWDVSVVKVYKLRHYKGQ